MEGKVRMSTRRMAKKLRVEHGLPISHMAVHKFLHAEGLEPHSRTQCTPLTDSQKRKRVEWRERFKNKRASWWRKVIFLDERLLCNLAGKPKRRHCFGDGKTPSSRHVVFKHINHQSRWGWLCAMKGRACIRTAHVVWTRLQQDGARTRHPSQRHFHGENVT